jgi:hypothetical protein
LEEYMETMGRDDGRIDEEKARLKGRACGKFPK